jgi:hypothetical protein
MLGLPAAMTVSKWVLPESCHRRGHDRPHVARRDHQRHRCPTGVMAGVDRCTGYPSPQGQHAQGSAASSSRPSPPPTHPDPTSRHLKAEQRHRPIIELWEGALLNALRYSICFRPAAAPASSSRVKLWVSSPAPRVSERAWPTLISTKSRRLPATISRSFPHN